ncbi:hypothetical protein MO973_25380 [Paenibacillus sp. TRM 82003]|nr:hypothetical protein [Paenibacillus sp. TRM 82003]
MYQHKEVHWSLFSIVKSYAETVGATNIQLTDEQIGSLAMVTDRIWDEINAHNAMELFHGVATTIGEKNAALYVSRTLHLFQEREDYLAPNGANHLLDRYLA